MEIARTNVTTNERASVGRPRKCFPNLPKEFAPQPQPKKPRGRPRKHVEPVPPVRPVPNRRRNDSKRERRFAAWLKIMGCVLELYEFKAVPESPNKYMAVSKLDASVAMLHVATAAKPVRNGRLNFGQTVKTLKECAAAGVITVLIGASRDDNGIVGSYVIPPTAEVIAELAKVNDNVKVQPSLLNKNTVSGIFAPFMETFRYVSPKFSVPKGPVATLQDHTASFLNTLSLACAKKQI